MEIILLVCIALLLVLNGFVLFNISIIEKDVNDLFTLLETYERE